MNLAIEKELRCAISVCMICYLSPISEIDRAWRRMVSSCKDDGAEEVKEILRRKGILAEEI